MYRSTLFAQLDLLLVPVLVAVAILAGVNVHPSSTHPTSLDRLIGVVMASALAVRAALLARCAVIVDDRSATFVVRNSLRQYELAWSDVERFGFVGSYAGRLFPMPGASWIVGALLKDGSKVKCTALRGGTRGKLREYEVEFNRMLEQRR